MNTPEAINHGGIGTTRIKPSYRPDLIVYYCINYDTGTLLCNALYSAMGSAAAINRCIDDLENDALTHGRTQTPTEWLYMRLPEFMGMMRRGQLQAIELESRAFGSVMFRGFYSLTEAPKVHRGHCAYLRYEGGPRAASITSTYRPATAERHSEALSAARWNYDI